MFSLIFLELTLRSFLTDIPHDAGAVLVYGLLGLLVAFTWHGSRAASRRTAAGPAPQVEQPRKPASAAQGPERR